MTYRTPDEEKRSELIDSAIRNVSELMLMLNTMWGMK